ncbi:hypothetical protein T439DRAFT_244935 [Meredithblackwellia eburnea MCA 4105]
MPSHGRGDGADQTGEPPTKSGSILSILYTNNHLRHEPPDSRPVPSTSTCTSQQQQQQQQQYQQQQQQCWCGSTPITPSSASTTTMPRPRPRPPRRTRPTRARAAIITTTATVLSLAPQLAQAGPLSPTKAGKQRYIPSQLEQDNFFLQQLSPSDDDEGKSGGPDRHPSRRRQTTLPLARPTRAPTTKNHPPSSTLAPTVVLNLDPKLHLQQKRYVEDSFTFPPLLEPTTSWSLNGRSGAGRNAVTPTPSTTTTTKNPNAMEDNIVQSDTLLSSSLDGSTLFTQVNPSSAGAGPGGTTGTAGQQTQIATPFSGSSSFASLSPFSSSSPSSSFPLSSTPTPTQTTTTTGATAASAVASSTFVVPSGWAAKERATNFYAVPVIISTSIILASIVIGAIVGSVLWRNQTRRAARRARRGE